MSDAKKCGQCQREIPSHAPFGICPVCVLNLATEKSEPLATESHPSPISDSIPEPHELTGKFPNLEILSLLGRGGMGAVYLARQTSLDRTVALKVLSSGLADDPSFTERFAREAKTLAKLTHPNIVTVFDSGQTGDANYLVMEYIEGVNLRDAIVSKTIDPARALAMVQQICDALQHAHDAGVVHRDIKPENILIDRNGLVKIADFGLAKLVQPKPEQYSLTGTRQVLGTRNYMAPEQIETPESVDHRADLYSLGVVLYELLTGELPIGRFAPPSSKSGCSKRLDDLVMRTLEKDPGQRFQQASMIGSAVRELESSISQSSGKRPLVQEITRAEYVEPMVREPLTDPLPFSISGLKSKPSHRSGNILHLGKAQGLMRTYDDRIDLEYRIHDPMDSDEPVLKQESVLMDNLSSVQFEPTWWGGGRLRFKAMTLGAVANIPKSKQGTFHVNVKQQDRGSAAEFADVANRKIVTRNPNRSGAKQSRDFDPTVTLEDIVLVDDRLKVPCIGFWIASAITLLAGIAMTALAILSVQSATIREMLVGPFGPNMQFPFIAGPLWLLAWTIPLFAANSLKRHRNYHFVIVALLLMLIPGITALMFVHIPLAIWGLVVLSLPQTRRVFRDASLRDRLAVDKKQPVLRRIPKSVFAAAIIVPTILLVCGMAIWQSNSVVTAKSDALTKTTIQAPHDEDRWRQEDWVKAKPDQPDQPDQPAGPETQEPSQLPAVPGVALPAPATMPSPATKPDEWQPVQRQDRLSTISTFGVVALLFLVFVMGLLAFMLFMLARSMWRTESGK